MINNFDLIHFNIHIHSKLLQCMHVMGPCFGVRKEGNVLFNDALNTFYFTVIWCLFWCKPALNEKGIKCTIINF